MGSRFGGYRWTFVYEAHKYFGLQVEISKKLKPHDWQVLPKRWIVERTFSWLNHSRRLSKDYDMTIASAETLIKISHIHTLLNRLWTLVLRIGTRLLRNFATVFNSAFAMRNLMRDYQDAFIEKRRNISRKY